MVDVDGKDSEYYMQMDIDWDHCEKAELEQAMRMARVDKNEHQHFGAVPDEFGAKPFVTAPPAVLAPQRPRRWTFIEYCWSETSLLCREKHQLDHNRLFRLTKEHDMTTPEGLRYALSVLRKKGSGIPVVHAALPCTWGSPMQSLRKSG